ncbi:hypothetical protein DFH09DRAFT_1104921 [Mycena vulgaris]|nr:hypothetical protein DFH09DRAFT_1104921 [Mycena vulgaris]
MANTQNINKEKEWKNLKLTPIVDEEDGSNNYGEFKQKFLAHEILYGRHGVRAAGETLPARHSGRPFNIHEMLVEEGRDQQSFGSVVLLPSAGSVPDLYKKRRIPSACSSPSRILSFLAHEILYGRHGVRAAGETHNTLEARPRPNAQRGQHNPTRAFSGTNQLMEHTNGQIITACATQPESRDGGEYASQLRLDKDIVQGQSEAVSKEYPLGRSSADGNTAGCSSTPESQDGWALEIKYTQSRHERGAHKLDKVECLSTADLKARPRSPPTTVEKLCLLEFMNLNRHHAVDYGHRKGLMSAALAARINMKDIARFKPGAHRTGRALRCSGPKCAHGSDTTPMSLLLADVQSASLGVTERRIECS